MADSIEQKLVSAILTRLKTIRTTAPNLVGYQTDIGVNVEDSQTNWNEDEQLPAISVFTRPLTIQRSEFT
jgi:hypothetical protein